MFISPLYMCLYHPWFHSTRTRAEENEAAPPPSVPEPFAIAVPLRRRTALLSLPYCPTAPPLRPLFLLAPFTTPV